MPRTAQSAVRGVVIGPVTPGAWPGYIGPHRPATPGRTPSARISTRRGALRPATVSAWPPPHTPGHGLGPATGDDRPATTGPAQTALGKRPGPLRPASPLRWLGWASAGRASAATRPADPRDGQRTGLGPAQTGRRCDLQRDAGTRRGPQRSAASKGRLLCRCRRITLGYARVKPAHNVSLCAIAAPKDRHSRRPRVRARAASASSSAARSVAVPPLCGQPVGHCAGLPAVHTRRHRRRAWRWGRERCPGRQGPPPARPSAPPPLSRPATARRGVPRSATIATAHRQGRYAKRPCIAAGAFAQTTFARSKWIAAISNGRYLKPLKDDGLEQV